MVARIIFILYLFAVELEAQCQNPSDSYVTCINESLTAVPDWLSEKVTFLDVSKNRINTLQVNILKNYPNLQHLNLAHNSITTSSNLRSISVLKNLESLDISDNNLKVLNFSDIASNLNLNTIVIDNNPQIEIIESNIELPNLKNLSLKNCNLKKLPHCEFKGFSGLEILDVRNNSIVSFSKYIPEVLPNLNKLLIGGNPLAVLTYGNEISLTGSNCTFENVSGFKADLSSTDKESSTSTESLNYSTIAMENNATSKGYGFAQVPTLTTTATTSNITTCDCTNNTIDSKELVSLLKNLTDLVIYVIILTVLLYQYRKKLLSLFWAHLNRLLSNNSQTPETSSGLPLQNLETDEDINNYNEEDQLQNPHAGKEEDS